MTFAIICTTFGRKFSYNAIDMVDAISKAKDRVHYHSIQFSDFTIEETTRNNDLHNEYIPNE